MTAVKWEHKEKKKKNFSIRGRVVSCKGVNIIREKFRVNNHGFGLMLLYSNIYEPQNKLNASNFTNDLKICIGNLVKLSRFGVCESKLLEMSFLWYKLRDEKARHRKKCKIFLLSYLSRNRFSEF